MSEKTESYSGGANRGFIQGIRLSGLSCLRPLHDLHMLCRLLSEWSGTPPVLDGGSMWSIVQSQPSRSLPHVTQIGSRCFFA